jgi:hypothetical protein
VVKRPSATATLTIVEVVGVGVGVIPGLSSSPHDAVIPSERARGIAKAALVNMSIS